jgi:hypothetical protein
MLIVDVALATVTGKHHANYVSVDSLDPRHQIFGISNVPLPVIKLRVISHGDLPSLLLAQGREAPTGDWRKRSEGEDTQQ